MSTNPRYFLVPLRQIQPRNRTFTQSAHHLDIPPFTRRLFKLPTPPSAPFQSHHDLPSFLAYSARSALPDTTTTYVGTHYEYTVLETLRTQSLALHRIGGRSDAGIDLVGTWHLPSHEHATRVVVQCKALRAKAGPNLVRELEGAYRTSLPGWRGEKIGMLVCPREATKGVRDAMAKSAFPLVWLMIRTDGTVKQALWNARVEEMGLGLLGLETMYGPDAGMEERVEFTWDGERLEHMDQVERDLLEAQRNWLKSWEVDEGVQEKLLDVVEELHPEEKPLLTGAGKRSTLSAEDRKRVLEVLHSRIHGPEGHS